MMNIKHSGYYGFLLGGYARSMVLDSKEECEAKDPDNCRYHKTGKYSDIETNIRKEDTVSPIEKVLAASASRRADNKEKTPQEEYDEVVARYTNADGTKKKGWMLAPNGKKTNLTERQWVQVRTPSFKKWFGNWEGNVLRM